MQGTSLSHAFDESLKYVYAKWGIFSAYQGFFEHDAATFVRFDTKELNKVKSCQLQFGMVNKLQYESLRPELDKHDREYQKKQWMSTMETGNFSWHLDRYGNSETLRRQTKG